MSTFVNNISPEYTVSQISEIKNITKEIFEDCCSPVVISDGETEVVHDNMELVQITPMGKEYWFVLRDISKAEMEKIKMQSDIEYIAMMAGVEL